MSRIEDLGPSVHVLMGDLDSKQDKNEKFWP